MKYVKSEFGKNILTLFSGHGFAQLFNLLGTLVLYTQLFKAEDFGFFAIFLSSSSILSILSTLRYDQAIVLPQKDGDASNIAVLSAFFVLLFSLLALILTFLLQRIFSDFYVFKDLKYAIYFLPFSILFFGLYQVLNFWMIRKKEFKAISYSKVFDGLTSLMVTCIIGYAFYTPFGIIIGYVLGQFAAMIVLAFRYFNGYKTELAAVDYISIKRMSKLYKDFPLYNLPQVFMDMVQKFGSVFIIEFFFGYRILGNYHLVYRVLRGPVALIGLSFSQVFYQKITEIYNDGRNCYEFMKKAIIKLSGMGIPIFILAFVFIGPVFNLFLNSDYSESTAIARILIPWMFFNFISSPISSFPLIVGKQFQFLLISGIGGVISLLVLFLSSQNSTNYFWPLVYYSTSMSILMITIILWNFSLGKMLNNKISRSSIKEEE